jgi:hypothetical protein
LSLFKTGIQPAWEDEVNGKGGDFCYKMMETNNMDTINKAWEDLILDIITKQFPFVEEITGARILDKSRAGQEQFRIEVWTKFSDQHSEAGKAMYSYIDTNYVSKLNSSSQKIVFSKHE